MNFSSAAAPIALLVFAGSALAAPIVLSCNPLTEQNTQRYESQMCPQFSGVGLLGVPFDLTGEMLSTIVFTSGGENTKTETEIEYSDFSLEPLVGSGSLPSLFDGTLTIPSRPSD